MVWWVGVIVVGRAGRVVGGRCFGVALARVAFRITQRVGANMGEEVELSHSPVFFSVIGLNSMHVTSGQFTISRERSFSS